MSANSSFDSSTTRNSVTVTKFVITLVGLRTINVKCRESKTQSSKENATVRRIDTELAQLEVGNKMESARTTVTR